MCQEKFGAYYEKMKLVNVFRNNMDENFSCIYTLPKETTEKLKVFRTWFLTVSVICI